MIGVSAVAIRLSAESMEPIYSSALWAYAEHIFYFSNCRSFMFVTANIIRNKTKSNLFFVPKARSQRRRWSKLQHRRYDMANSVQDRWVRWSRIPAT